MPFQGACLCGETTISVESQHDSQIICHCLDCKQTSGSAFSTNILAPQKDVTITGPISTFDMKAASGNTVSRVFCTKCGSAISHKSVAFGEAQAIQTGNFKAFAKIPVALELFVKDRWDGIPAVSGATQVQIMPESS